MLNSLKNALPTIARHFADDVGVQLVWGAAHAHTWDKKIYLPNLKEEEGVSKLALGYTAHETAHIIHSDQTVYVKAGGEAPFVVKLMNVLEDVRIEGLMMKRFPIVREWLTHTVKVVLGGTFKADGCTEAEVLHNAALAIGRARLLNQPLQQESEAMITALDDSFGVGRKTKIMALLGKIPSCENTEDIYSLTHQILDVLDEPDEDEPTPPEPDEDESPDDQGDDSTDQGNGGGQGQDQGEDGSGDKSGSDSSGGQNGSDSNGNPSQGQASGDAGDSNGAGSSGGSVSQTTDANGSQGSLKQKVLSATKDECDQLVSDLGDEAAKVLGQMTDTNASCSPAGVVSDPVGSELLGRETVMRGRAASIGLKPVLMGLIQGSRNCKPKASQSGKTIIASRLARVSVGETRIFRRTEPVQRVNCAFQILLDGSSSMSFSVVGKNPKPVQVVGKKDPDQVVGKKAMRIAEEAVFALLSALEGIQGISTGAMVFPRNGPSGQCVGVLKRHKQSLQHAVNEGRFGLVETGGTPLAEAIWPAAGDVLAAKGERKVMIVITDGDPNESHAAKLMVDRCRATGIEVFAVAFGRVSEPTLETVFGHGNWKFITDLNQLRSALDHLVRRVLTQTAA